MLEPRFISQRGGTRASIVGGHGARQSGVVVHTQIGVVGIEVGMRSRKRACILAKRRLRERESRGMNKKEKRGCTVVHKEVVLAKMPDRKVQWRGKALLSCILLVKGLFGVWCFAGFRLGGNVHEWTGELHPGPNMRSVQSEQSWDWTKGWRVGEALNPGPYAAGVASSSGPMEGQPLWGEDGSSGQQKTKMKRDILRV